MLGLGAYLNIFFIKIHPRICLKTSSRCAARSCLLYKSNHKCLYTTMQPECSAVLEESAAGNFFNRRPQDNSVSNDISNLQRRVSVLFTAVEGLQEDNRKLRTELQKMRKSLSISDKSSEVTQSRMDETLEEIYAKAHQNEEQIEALSDAFVDFLQNIAHENAAE